VTVSSHDPSPDVTATAPVPATDHAGAAARALPKQPGIVRIFPRACDGACEVWSGRAALLLGRAPESDVHLTEQSASRKHAALQCRVSGVSVRDLGSRHGTFVQGEPIGGAEVVAPYGSLLRAGESLFLCSDDVRPYARPPLQVPGSQLGTKRSVVAGPKLSAVWDYAARVATLPHPALILGPSGSGKEAIARIIHANSQRKGPFVAINAAAIAPALFESELFGHVRGAFTGAQGPRTGAFRDASGGVLFLDEIADLQTDLQVKLLRAIDQMCIRPLGGSEDVAVDVRIVAATSQDLQALCDEGVFRLDFFYRLSGIVITVPALQERPDDVALLGAWLVKEHGFELSAASVEALAMASWPGNVRELEHALTQAMVQASTQGGRQIRPEHLPSLTAQRPALAAHVDLAAVRRGLAANAGNAAAAARELGISRTTLYNILKRAGAEPSSLRPK
jgi:transcriptional regulator of acetoin/glycerol metabolism